MIKLGVYIILVDGCLYNNTMNFPCFEKDLLLKVEPKKITVLKHKIQKQEQTIFYIKKYKVVHKKCFSFKYPFHKIKEELEYIGNLTYNNKIVYFLVRQNAINLINKINYVE